MSVSYRFNIVQLIKSYPRFKKIFLFVFSFSALTALGLRPAQGVDISNEAMEAAANSAPPNIMFVLDNSGSMDWEVMTGESEGTFKGYYYIFDNAGDNAYSGSILLDSNRGYYQGQCSRYNKMFYNPHVEYLPWPGFTDASTTTPISNPYFLIDGVAGNDNYKLDLRAQYWSVVEGCNEYIVNDQDGAPGFTMTGAWSLTYDSQAYNTDYYWTPSDGAYTASWNKVIPATGQYQVFARWVANDYRYTSVVYRVIHASGTTPVTVNQRLNGGLWNSLGTYTFNAGSTATVALNFTRTGDDQRRCADAIKFVPVSCPTLRINNAHYYTWDDTDGDGDMDAGETVYLVNFIDSNSDNVLDSRKYYRLYDDGDQKVETGELREVAVLPDNCKPAVLDEDGNLDHYMSAAEELQSFANWYSFYRRRELASKAAVSNTLIDLNGVKVGLYTIHPTGSGNVGVRQSVLPIKLNVSGASVIVDNQDSRFSVKTSSKWSESSASNEYNNSSKSTKTSNEWAKWTPNLPETGTYNVYAWWNYVSTGDTNALYTIHHAGGDVTQRKNQKQNYSQWVLLGQYTFNAGTSGYVMVTRDGSSTGTYTNADAVMFELVGGAMHYEDQTNTLMTQLYSIESANGTPLRVALDNVGKYFDADDGDDGGLGTAPWASAAEGGACQKSFAIVMTDGFWNESFSSVGNQDSDQGVPYADTYSNTLADVAMKYYKNDLADSLDNSAAPSGCDQATYQHLATYTVSFGVTGTLDPDTYDYYGDDPCLATHTPGGTSGWPNPTSTDRAKIDDLLHAAVNGRGRFFSASDPEQLVNSLKEIVEHVEAATSSGASVSVNGEELSEDTVLFQARFESANWTGEVIAKEIDPRTRVISTEELWNASEQLQAVAADDRKIVTFNSSSNVAIPFQADELNDFQKYALDPGWATDIGSPTLIEKLVDFLRGEEIEGFRARAKKLGDIVHSAPVYVSSYVPANDDGQDNDRDSITDEGADGVDNDHDGQTDETDEWEWKEQATLYTGANDGMVHAFNADDGTERFAYIPNLLFDEKEDVGFSDYVSRLRLLAATDYSHRFFVDLTPVCREISDTRPDGLDNDGDHVTDERIDDGVDNDGDGLLDEADEWETKETRTILVGGLGYGGKGYYGLTLRRATQSGGVWTQLFDANGWGTTTSESTIAANLSPWEYPDLETLNSDGVDNDGDGLVDEGTDGVDNDGDGQIDERDEYENDPDMGYSFSQAFIVKSFCPTHPWVVVFGNGYNSPNGDAVLYVLDAYDGTLIRKIQTGSGPTNGLSAPALVALDNKEQLLKWNTDGVDNDGDQPSLIDEGTDNVDNTNPFNDAGAIDEGPFDGLDNDNDGYVDEVSNSRSAEIGEWEKAKVALDDKLAFAYAGDLKGNLWKFDLSSPDPADWDVAYKCRADQDCNADGSINPATGDVVGNPQPLFQTVGQSITSKPDVMAAPGDLQGHMVIFGTGRYLGMIDRSGPFDTQTLYGIWDYGDSYDPNKHDATNYYDSSEYLGFLNRGTGELSNFSADRKIKMLKQEELPSPSGWISYTDMHGNTFELRVTTDNDASYAGIPDKNGIGLFWDPDGNNWQSDAYDNDGDGQINESYGGCYSWAEDGLDNDGDGDIDEDDEKIDDEDDENEGCGHWPGDGLDNDGDGSVDEADEAVTHVGWYFDLPGYGDKAHPADVRSGERIIEDIIIRGGVVIAISSVPSDTPCSGGGESMVMELDAYTGARLSSAQFDINGDGKVDEEDMISLGTDINGDGVIDSNDVAAPTGRVYDTGLLQEPIILDAPGETELKVLSDSSGGTVTQTERGEAEKFKYWKEVSEIP